MQDVSVAHAKDHLEELIARAARGEDVCIRDQTLGRMRLAPADAATSGADLYPPRVLGQWEGIVDIPVDRLFAPLTEDELAWLSGGQSAEK